MFSALLKKHLISRNISQKQLSILTQISESTISKFLSDEREPRFSQIIKIITALRLKPEHFFGGTFSKENFEVFINDLVLIRPVFEDKNSCTMAHTVMAFKKFKYMHPYTLKTANHIFFCIMHAGSMTFEGKPLLSAGEYALIDSEKYTITDVVVEAGTHYTVIHFIKEGSFNVVEHSKIIFESIVPA